MWYNLEENKRGGYYMVVEGMGFYYSIENNILTISDKKGKVLLSAPAEECEILFYSSHELLGTGEVVWFHPAYKKPIIDRFNKKFRDIYDNLYDTLKGICIIRNLSRVDAEVYRGEEKQLKKDQAREDTATKKAENQAKLKQAWADRTAKQKAEIAAKNHEKEMIKKKCQKLIEYECTCQRCKKVFYYDNLELLNNAARQMYAAGSILLGRGAIGVLVSGQTKDLDKCPNCGSKAIIKTEKVIWLDKQGNVIEMQ
jgi:rRNA maturation endonuclease Nob1